MEKDKVIQKEKVEEYRVRPRGDRSTFWRRHFPITEAGYNLSWGSVLAGVVTTFAIFLLLSLITSAIGFGTFKPTNENPVEGMGTGMMIWSVISLLISLLAGGFVAGLAARRTGLLHGFLTWALTTLLMLGLLTSLISSAFGLVGNVVGTAADAAGSVAGTVAEGTGNAAGAVFDKAGQEISQVDTQELQSNVEQTLRDTDIPELQPEYIQGILDESKDDIAQAGKDIAVNPENKDQIIKELSEKLKTKVEDLKGAADKEKISQALSQNTEMTPEEAQEATDNIYQGLDTATKEASQQIDNASKTIQETSVKVDQKVEETKVVAEDTSEKASGGSVALFVGLLLGLAVASFGGILGSKKVTESHISEE